MICTRYSSDVRGVDRGLVQHTLVQHTGAVQDSGSSASQLHDSAVHDAAAAEAPLATPTSSGLFSGRTTSTAPERDWLGGVRRDTAPGGARALPDHLASSASEVRSLHIAPVKLPKESALRE